MGKGKRNRQLHYEDRQASPAKQQKKKQSGMPKWAKNTIAITLAVLLVAGIVFSALWCNGTFMRNRILVESKTGKNDINQQMATFLVWQSMYQQGYYEYYYMQWGIYEDENGILDAYSSAAEYGMAIASTYSKEYLRDGIDGISDYLIELVAGADAAVNANLSLNDDDMKDVQSTLDWMYALYTSSGAAVTYDKFLNEVVGENVKKSDIEDAAKLVVLYNKYCDYKGLELDNIPDEEKTLQEFIEKNPAGHFEVSYRQYKNASPDFLIKLFKQELQDAYDSEYKDLVSAEEYEQILEDLITASNTSDNKSAEELAKEFLTKLTADKSVAWPNKNTKTVKAPAENADADAFQSVLFDEKATIESGKILQADDDGTSYVIKVTGGDKDNGFTVEYATFTDSDYYKVFRAAMKEIEELSVSAEDFQKLVLTDIMENQFNGILITKYLIPGAVQNMKDELTLTSAELDTLVTELGLTSTEYKSNDTTIPTAIANWLFDSARKKDDTALIEVGNDEYIVNVFAAATATEETDDDGKKINKISAGFAKYDGRDKLLADFEIKQYIKADTDGLTAKGEDVAEWAYSMDRKAGDYKFFVTDEAVYLVYINEAPKTATIGSESVVTVKAALKEYKKSSASVSVGTALGLKETEYKNDNTTLPAEVKTWIFNTARKAGDYDLIKSGEKYYLAYTYGTPADGAVKAGYAECTLTEKQYNNVKDTLTADFATIAEWAYNSKRADGDMNSFTVDDTVYLVYVVDPNTNTTTSEKEKLGNTSYTYTKLAIKTYTLEDAPEADEMEAKYDSFLADLIADKASESKSADDKAKNLYELLAGENGDKTKWDELTADLEVKTSTVTKPAENASSTTAMQDLLYGSADQTVAVGDIYKLDENGTSRVLKITKVAETSAYTYDYVTFEDDEYYSIFRSLQSARSSSFADATDLIYPESLSTATNQWLFSGKYNEDTKKYEFDREKNDVMHFAVVSNSTATGDYNVCIVIDEVKQDKNTDPQVYGGYLLFETKGEADKALKNLGKKTGFELWHAFSALSVTTGEGDDETTTAATVSSTMTKDSITDTALENWLFGERTGNDVAVIKGTDGYYLAYFFTSDETWIRTAKDDWVAEKLTENLAELVKGYEINQKNLDKIGEPKLTTDTTTAANS
ncbi:MAG: hypothetical protein IJW49_00225 [Clostridia bacterium]|nr:hypothetical protein [Clostridia bacterium]